MVTFTHLDRVIWPEEGYTKADLLEYYRNVAPFILPYLKDRPERVRRQTKGIYGRSFFHNDAAQFAPDWVETARIYSERDGREIDYLLCQDEATLLFMINTGCIEINPWHSRVAHLQKPDYLVLDLDPLDIAFHAVVEAALVTKDVLDGVGVPSSCKTSGGDGLHIYVPLGARYSQEQAFDFARLINILVNGRLTGTTSIDRSPARRRGRVYLDALQNKWAKALAAPYCARPRKGATVSTPLTWKEVRPGLDPTTFTIRTLPRRLKKVGDLWRGVLGPGIDMEACLARLEKMMKV